MALYPRPTSLHTFSIRDGSSNLQASTIENLLLQCPPVAKLYGHSTLFWKPKHGLEYEKR